MTKKNVICWKRYQHRHCDRLKTPWGAHPNPLVGWEGVTPPHSPPPWVGASAKVSLFVESKKILKLYCGVDIQYGSLDVTKLFCMYFCRCFVCLLLVFECDRSHVVCDVCQWRIQEYGMGEADFPSPSPQPFHSLSLFPFLPSSLLFPPSS